MVGAAVPCGPPKQLINNNNDNERKGNEMKLNIDWRGMLKAVLKAIWPFVAGAAGGLFSGCSVFGSGLGPTVV